jgi:ABC-type Zn uptake system ZnuABC Zn-binding protein ZnuA
MPPRSAGRTDGCARSAARFAALFRFVAIPAVVCIALTASAHADTVMTGTQATYSLTSALAADTAIEVVNVPADGRELAVLADYIARRMDRLAPDFAAATAVVTLTNALPGDPLYRFAREANIRIVDIDAALPWSLSIPGVALTESPRSNVGWGGDTDTPVSGTAPCFWLSIPNAVRMADIIAHDLSLIFPDSAATITMNLDALKRDLLALRSTYQDRLIETDDATVFALAGDFVYLTNDMGLYVDGYFIKQDIRWTADDLAAFTQHLTDHGIRVVIHKWQPSEAIQAAAAAAGAKIVVLQSGDPGIVEDDALARDGLQRILAADLEAIYTALQP